MSVLAPDGPLLCLETSCDDTSAALVRGRTVLACLAGVESYRTNQPVAVRSLEA